MGSVPVFSEPLCCSAVERRENIPCECMGNIQYGGVGNTGAGLQQMQTCSRYMQLPCFQSLLQQCCWGNTPEMDYVAAFFFFCQLGIGAAAFSPNLKTKAVPAVGHCQMVPSCDQGFPMAAPLAGGQQDRGALSTASWRPASFLAGSIPWRWP